VSAAGAPVPTDNSHAARAAIDSAEVARFRDIAAKERQLITAYASRPTAVAANVTDWNAKLTTAAQARATAADQIAARLQTIVDFHLAAAANGSAK
jgi:hypothetical protein